MTVDRAGRVIVSEKAGPRAKIYSPEGELLTVVSDDAFDPAAKNMDIAVDPAGRIYVVDTERLEVREPLRRRAPLVEDALLGLGGLPDAALRLGIAHDDELPRLPVRPRGSAGGGGDRRVDDVLGHVIGSEVANRAPLPHAVSELDGTAA